MSGKIAEDVFIADGAAIVGDVEIGKGSSVWFNATIRGDCPIRIGEYSNIQDNTVIHVDEGMDVQVGNYVTVGHACILHCCHIEDNALIGMGSIVMNNAHVGKNCMIGAGSLVTEGKEIPEGSLCFGRPAKVIRQLTEEEIESLRADALLYTKKAAEYRQKQKK